jgi:hypothetical protein
LVVGLAGKLAKRYAEQRAKKGRLEKQRGEPKPGEVTRKHLDCLSKTAYLLQGTESDPESVVSEPIAQTCEKDWTFQSTSDLAGRATFS